MGRSDGGGSRQIVKRVVVLLDPVDVVVTSAPVRQAYQLDVFFATSTEQEATSPPRPCGCRCIVQGLMPGFRKRQRLLSRRCRLGCKAPAKMLGKRFGLNVPRAKQRRGPRGDPQTPEGDAAQTFDRKPEILDQTRAKRPFDHRPRETHRRRLSFQRQPVGALAFYDQAMLAMAYLEAYQALGREEFAQTAREIFAYVLRDMTSPEGGFYSAEDADSEGK